MALFQYFFQNFSFLLHLPHLYDLFPPDFFLPLEVELTFSLHEYIVVREEKVSFASMGDSLSSILSPFLLLFLLKAAKDR